MTDEELQSIRDIASYIRSASTTVVLRLDSLLEFARLADVAVNEMERLRMERDATAVLAQYYYDRMSLLQ